MIQFPDSDQPEVCLPMLKASELQIVKNWDTFGLRGSGSNQVIAENVYVPMERIVRLMLQIQQEDHLKLITIKIIHYTMFHFIQPFILVFQTWH